jgi:hypothetical protein
MPGRHWTDLVPPDVAAERADWVWVALLEAGWVRSTTRIRRPDGTEVSIEYRSEVVGDGRYRSCWRLVGAATTHARVSGGRRSRCW